MDESLKRVEVTAFDAARIRALEAYAGLEFMLSNLLSSMLKVDLRDAHAVFYRVVNARSRCAILADLLKLRHGDQFNASWRSIEGRIKHLDGRRNELVHWMAFVHDVAPNDDNAVRSGTKKLVNPRAMLSKGQASETSWTLRDINEFQQSVGKLHLAVQLFTLALRSLEGAPDALRDILQRPLTDQSLEDLGHILYSPKAPDNPPQSSPP